MQKDTDHPFFKPLWRRILIVVFCFSWSGFEYSQGNPTWALITLAIAVYALWTFIISYKSQDDSQQQGEDPGSKS